MATVNYGTDSELIREALREKQNRTAEIESIRAALIESENTHPFIGYSLHVFMKKRSYNFSQQTSALCQ